MEDAPRILKADAGDQFFNGMTTFLMMLFQFLTVSPVMTTA